MLLSRVAGQASGASRGSIRRWVASDAVDGGSSQRLVVVLERRPCHEGSRTNQGKARLPDSVHRSGDHLAGRSATLASPSPFDGACWYGT